MGGPQEPSYVTITDHFIDISWHLRNFVLQPRPLFESHAAETLVNVLKKAVEDWKMLQIFD